MRHSAKEEENANIKEPLKTVLKGLGYSLVELTISRQKGSVQVRVVIYNGASIGTNDCSKVHRAIMPRLELEFAQQAIYLEVSSAGIERLIKDTEEFALYKGKMVRCYRTDISDWTKGLLESIDEKGVVIKTKDGLESLEFEIIAKARLDSSIL